MYDINRIDGDTTFIFFLLTFSISFAFTSLILATMACGNDYLVVAAIDFGTTFSGYAFSMYHEYQSDPTKCSTFTWTAGSGGLQSLKSSTCVLFDKHKKFAAFGFEAEDKYSDLALENEHHNWYFFRRFKMQLYKQIVSLC